MALCERVTFAQSVEPEHLFSLGRCVCVAGPGSGACTRTDIELDQAGDAETALTADWLAGEFPELEASRAAKGGALPPVEPPRVRTFPGWTFARIYWLDATDGAAGKRTLDASRSGAQTHASRGPDDGARPMRRGLMGRMSSGSMVRPSRHPAASGCVASDF